MSDSPLTNAVANAVADGWVVNTQTSTSASLTRQRRFSWGWFILWFILFLVIGGVIYWIYWMTRKPETMLIRLGMDGEVIVTTG